VKDIEDIWDGLKGYEEGEKVNIEILRSGSKKLYLSPSKVEAITGSILTAGPDAIGSEANSSFPKISRDSRRKFASSWNKSNLS
jgi:hypothetical protein